MRNNGFLLHGNQVKMKGVNLHHDGGAVAAAFPERVWESQLQILKDGGCNAIRTGHNPMATELLDLCNKSEEYLVEFNRDKFKILICYE